MLFLLACVAPDPVSALDALGADVSDVLFAAEPTEVAAALTVVPWDGAAGRLGAEGPPFGGIGPHARAEGRLAVVEAGDDVRVLLRNEGVRLLVWLDLEGRVNVTPTAMWLDGSGHAVEGLGAGIRVPAGRFVSDPRGEPTVGFWEVVPELHVPIAPALIDDIWVPDDPRELRALAAQLEHPEDPVSLFGGTVLSDDDGVALLQFEESPCVVATGEVLARDDARELVLVAYGYDEAAVYVRGWIDPRPEPEELGCLRGYRTRQSSACFLGVRSLELPPPPTWPLPAGALLYDAPDGAIVGVTERFVRLERGAEAGAMPGWEPLLAPSPWGPDVVWVRTGEGPDLEPDPLDAAVDDLPPEDIPIRAADAAADAAPGSDASDAAP